MNKFEKAWRNHKYSSKVLEGYNPYCQVPLDLPYPNEKQSDMILKFYEKIKERLNPESYTFKEYIEDEGIGKWQDLKYGTSLDKVWNCVIEQKRLFDKEVKNIRIDILRNPNTSRWLIRIPKDRFSRELYDATGILGVDYSAYKFLNYISFREFMGVFFLEDIDLREAFNYCKYYEREYRK